MCCNPAPFRLLPHSSVSPSVAILLFYSEVVTRPALLSFKNIGVNQLMCLFSRHYTFVKGGDTGSVSSRTHQLCQPFQADW